MPFWVCHFGMAFKTHYNPFGMTSQWYGQIHAPTTQNPTIAIPGPLVAIMAHVHTIIYPCTYLAKPISTLPALLDCCV
jgi:hypothetical protein